MKELSIAVNDTYALGLGGSKPEKGFAAGHELGVLTLFVLLLDSMEEGFWVSWLSQFR